MNLALYIAFFTGLLNVFHIFMCKNLICNIIDYFLSMLGVMILSAFNINCPLGYITMHFHYLSLLVRSGFRTVGPVIRSTSLHNIQHLQPPVCPLRSQTTSPSPPLTPWITQFIGAQIHLCLQHYTRALTVSKSTRNIVHIQNCLWNVSKKCTRNYAACK